MDCSRLTCPSPSPRVCSNSCSLSQWCHQTISSSAVPFSWLQSFPVSVFSSESVLLFRWPKHWRFSFSISPSNGYSELISFRIDWSDLLAVQGTLKSLIQHHCLEASILQRSAFFMVQLSHSYTTTGRTIGLTIPSFLLDWCGWNSFSDDTLKRELVFLPKGRGQTASGMGLKNKQSFFFGRKVAKAFLQREQHLPRPQDVMCLACQPRLPYRRVPQELPTLLSCSDPLSFLNTPHLVPSALAICKTDSLSLRSYLKTL